MENMRQKIAEIITHTHKTPLEQADEILLLFGVIKSVCEHEYITSADWKSQTCIKCHHIINISQTVL